MITTKLVTQRQTDKCRYSLYSVDTDRSNGYLFELAEDAGASMALLQSDNSDPLSLLQLMADTDTTPCELAEIIEDFRRNSLYNDSTE